MSDTDEILGWEVEELALRMLGFTDQEATKAIDDLSVDTDALLHDKYGVGLQQFAALVTDLIPFTPVVASAITEHHYHAFVDQDEKRAILKRQVKRGG